MAVKAAKAVSRDTGSRISRLKTHYQKSEEQVNKMLIAKDAVISKSRKDLEKTVERASGDLNATVDKMMAQMNTRLSRETAKVDKEFRADLAKSQRSLEQKLETTRRSAGGVEESAKVIT